MASSQSTVQFFLHGEVICSQGKYHIMNIWEYFEQEAKKNGLLVKCDWKISNTIGKGFSHSQQ